LCPRSMAGSGASDWGRAGEFVTVMAKMTAIKKVADLANRPAEGRLHLRIVTIHLATRGF
jgi:hypothetical protein